MARTTTLHGYRWGDGSIGIRNHVLVVSVMDNVNGVARSICKLVRGAVPVTHPYGRAQLGEDKERHLSTLAGLAANPNVGAVVIVSLEGVHARLVVERIRQAKPIETVVINECGGALSAIHKGAAAAAGFSVEVSARRREAVPLSELQVGVECGGSDGSSGVVSNPVVGLLTERLVERGATVVLSEPSEWIGAEEVLANRARTRDLAERIIATARKYEEYAAGQGVDLRGVNPAPDNIAGGISTIEEKSLGSIAKGGRAPVVELVGYGERPSQRGLVLLDAPAAAVENVTSMAAGGAHLCVFTTGSGNPASNPVMPVLRVSANPTTLASGLDADVPLDTVWRGEETLAQAADRLFQRMMATAGGQLTLAEVFEEGEIAISRCGFSL